jgi:hypothetical protein
MSEATRPGIWDQMVPEDAERWGRDILDPAARKRWCQAVMFGGLPYLWRHVAIVPREVAIDKLELRRGDRVLIAGEALPEIGFEADISEIVGPEGEIASVDMRTRVFEEFHAGRVAKWEWDYTRDYPDEHFDCVFVGQGVAHAGDWAREGRELLRVLRAGRRMVMAEISFSETFYARVQADVHLEYWVRKLMEGIGESFEALPYWNLVDVAAALDGALDELDTFEWRGVDLLWGRKPAVPAPAVGGALAST